MLLPEVDLVGRLQLRSRQRPQTVGCHYSRTMTTPREPLSPELTTSIRERFEKLSTPGFRPQISRRPRTTTPRKLRPATACVRPPPPVVKKKKNSVKEDPLIRRFLNHARTDPGLTTMLCALPRYEMERITHGNIYERRNPYDLVVTNVSHWDAISPTPPKFGEEMAFPEDDDDVFSSFCARKLLDRVPRDRKLPPRDYEYVTLSRHGVMYFYKADPGELQASQGELISLEEWEREIRLYDGISRLKFLNETRVRLWRTFLNWRCVVSRQRFLRQRAKLIPEFLLADKAFVRLVQRAMWEIGGLGSKPLATTGRDLLWAADQADDSILDDLIQKRKHELQERAKVHEPEIVAHETTKLSRPHTGAVYYPCIHATLDEKLAAAQSYLEKALARSEMESDLKIHGWNDEVWEPSPLEPATEAEPDEVVPEEPPEDKENDKDVREYLGKAVTRGVQLQPFLRGQLAVLRRVREAALATLDGVVEALEDAVDEILTDEQLPVKNELECPHDAYDLSANNKAAKPMSYATRHHATEYIAMAGNGIDDTQLAATWGKVPSFYTDFARRRTLFAKLGRVCRLFEVMLLEAQRDLVLRYAAEQSSWYIESSEEQEKEKIDEDLPEIEDTVAAPLQLVVDVVPDGFRTSPSLCGLETLLSDLQNAMIIVLGDLPRLEDYPVVQIAIAARVATEQTEASDLLREWHHHNKNASKAQNDSLTLDGFVDWIHLKCPDLGGDRENDVLMVGDVSWDEIQAWQAIAAAAEQHPPDDCEEDESSDDASGQTASISMPATDKASCVIDPTERFKRRFIAMLADDGTYEEQRRHVRGAVRAAWAAAEVTLSRHDHLLAMHAALREWKDEGSLTTDSRRSVTRGDAHDVTSGENKVLKKSLQFFHDVAPVHVVEKQFPSSSEWIKCGLPASETIRRLESFLAVMREHKASVEKLADVEVVATSLTALLSGPKSKFEATVTTATELLREAMPMLFSTQCVNMIRHLAKTNDYLWATTKSLEDYFSRLEKLRDISAGFQNLEGWSNEILVMRDFLIAEGMLAQGRLARQAVLRSLQLARLSADVGSLTDFRVRLSEMLREIDATSKKKFRLPRKPSESSLGTLASPSAETNTLRLEDELTATLHDYWIQLERAIRDCKDHVGGRRPAIRTELSTECAKVHRKIDRVLKEADAEFLRSSATSPDDALNRLRLLTEDHHVFSTEAATLQSYQRLYNGHFKALAYDEFPQLDVARRRLESREILWQGIADIDSGVDAFKASPLDVTFFFTRGSSEESSMCPHLSLNNCILTAETALKRLEAREDDDTTSLPAWDRFVTTLKDAKNALAVTAALTREFMLESYEPPFWDKLSTLVPPLRNAVEATFLERPSSLRLTFGDIAANAEDLRIGDLLETLEKDDVARGVAGLVHEAAVAEILQKLDAAVDAAWPEKDDGSRGFLNLVAQEKTEYFKHRAGSDGDLRKSCAACRAVVDSWDREKFDLLPRPPPRVDAAMEQDVVETFNRRVQAWYDQFDTAEGTLDDVLRLIELAATTKLEISSGAPINLVQMYQQGYAKLQRGLMELHRLPRLGVFPQSSNFLQKNPGFRGSQVSIVKNALRACRSQLEAARSTNDTHNAEERRQREEEEEAAVAANNEEDTAALALDAVGGMIVASSSTAKRPSSLLYRVGSRSRLVRGRSRSETRRTSGQQRAIEHFDVVRQQRDSLNPSSSRPSRTDIMSSLHRARSSTRGANGFVSFLSRQQRGTDRSDSTDENTRPRTYTNLNEATPRSSDRRPRSYTNIYNATT